MTASDKPGRAVIYARVSTMRQAEADLSLPDQIKQLQDYCARKQLAVVDIFTEPGASALDEDRPIFQEMIGRATSGGRPYDLVVVHSLSRFSRDTMHSEFYVRKLAKAGVRLVSITQELGQDGHGDLIRKIVNAFDEHQSRENAKHTHRAMMENARQGFWNGASPPFGYATIVKERRGNKDKKVLVIKEDEARIVRQIVDLYLGADGPPKGLKSIVNFLNERCITRRGRRFGVGSLQDMLTTSTYSGRHYFNQTDSRMGQKRPRTEWVEVAVPAIIEPTAFDRLQAVFRARAPRVTAPRITNGPTMLAGVARCATCGAAMILNTGKGGTYRYYCCSRSMKQGKTACTGMRIRMDRLDGLVLDHLSGTLFAPERLEDLLGGYLAQEQEGRAALKEKLRQAREARGDIDAKIARLLALVESGAMEPDDPTLKDRLVGLRLQKTELNQEMVHRQDALKGGDASLTREKLDVLSVAMRKRLAEGPQELRQAYMRLLLEAVTIDHHSVRLEGSPAVLEKLARNGPSKSCAEVLSFAQGWRPREDSNLRPPV
jgi:site-specific DNA recombinase